MSVSEDFKEIQGFPNYAIFKDGSVVNCETGYVLKHGKDKDGYPITCIMFKGKAYILKIHRLLAQAFIPNPENLPVVDHINRDRSDNRLENLRWATIQDNALNTDYIAFNKLGYKYISFNTQNKRYLVSKRIDGIPFNEYFKTLEEAIAFRDSILQ